MNVQEPHEKYETQGQVKQLRLICHCALRNEIGAWGFKAQVSDSQDDKKSRHLVIRCLSCHTDRSFRLKKNYLW